MQGLFSFEGAGIDDPVPFPSRATYRVPSDRRAQTVYFRAGNPTAELIYLVLLRNGTPMRYFPVGAKDAIHVSLAVVEDLSPESEMELLIGAPKGVAGTLVVDVGFVEIA